MSIDSVYNHSLRAADRKHLLEANPFAKKTDVGPLKTGMGIGNKKPAAIGLQKSLHKSETFFEKVEAAEMSTDPPKREQGPLVVSPFLP